ncbi:host-nuclease inhibitor Gam family protein [Clostridium sp.]|uniref:host-nuclease inhibitor Gam family protein n=1 Tax=Clostridium sp. TaxID=1506 RepID=UPI00262D5D23|nr:host-nuclease inhibitor Gam family protein [Clostridium sp.]
MNMLLQNDLQEIKELREEFKVTDLQSATWVLRKLRAVNEKMNEINNVAAEQIASINEWAEKEVKSLNDDKEYFESLLSAYYIEERAKDKKFKLSTPYGKVTSRKTSKYIYEDEQAIMDYCYANEIDAIRVKTELDKTALKKLCKDGVNQATGEIVPGVRVETVENISIKAE